MDISENVVEQCARLYDVARESEKACSVQDKWHCPFSAEFENSAAEISRAFREFGGKTSRININPSSDLNDLKSALLLHDIIRVRMGYGVSGHFMPNLPRIPVRNQDVPFLISPELALANLNSRHSQKIDGNVSSAQIFTKLAFTTYELSLIHI